MRSIDELLNRDANALMAAASVPTPGALLFRARRRRQARLADRASWPVWIAQALTLLCIAGYLAAGISALEFKERLALAAVAVAAAAVAWNWAIAIAQARIIK